MLDRTLDVCTTNVMTTNARTGRLDIRISPVETAMLRELAALDGLTVSDYLRLTIRRQHGERCAKPQRQRRANGGK